MSAITPEKAERIKQIERDVVLFWNATEDAFEQCIFHADKASVSAWSVGRLLIEAKSVLGHGNFGLWQEKMGIIPRTAQRYMVIAAKYDTVDALLKHQREARLAIGLIPDKEHVQHEDDTTLKTSTHHLQFVNRWSNWLNQVKIGKIKYDPEKTKADLKPLYSWLRELYGDSGA